MRLIQEVHCTDWDASFSPESQVWAVDSMESGKILLMPKLAFNLLAHEINLLSPEYADPKAKNISFNRGKNSLRCAKCSDTDYNNLKAMMSRFSQHAEKLVRQLMVPYADALQLGRTSYRPVEISGRPTSYRKDDTRLHVDAFPATPNQGQRILRVFTNINPDGEDRVWRVGENFADVAKQFLPGIAAQKFGKAALLKTLRITKSRRSEYDHLMLQIHDRMKADLNYQESAEQSEINFTPGSTWIVQTDHVSHAAMSGQYVLEQTFYLPVKAMVNPEYSPLRTLEKLTGKRLV